MSLNIKKPQISFFLEASESFLLYNNWNQLCLTHALPNAARGASCDQTDPNQQWRWVDGLCLQNVGSGQCVTSTATGELFEMQACVDGEQFSFYNVSQDKRRTIRIKV